MPSTTKPQPDIEALLTKINALEEKLGSLQGPADKQQDYYLEQTKRAEKIKDQSLASSFEGDVTWSVTVPGFVSPVWFNSDVANEQAAIREFETRFGTRFVTNAQRDEDNHSIKRVETT